MSALLAGLLGAALATISGIAIAWYSRLGEYEKWIRSEKLLLFPQYLSEVEALYEVLDDCKPEQYALNNDIKSRLKHISDLQDKVFLLCARNLELVDLSFKVLKYLGDCARAQKRPVWRDHNAIVSRMVAEFAYSLHGKKFNKRATTRAYDFRIPPPSRVGGLSREQASI